MKSSLITILVDNDSWILPYANQLVSNLVEEGFDATLIRNAEDIRNGWVCFLLGCVSLIESRYLERNEHNIIVHESDLPKGKGFAPMTWQILEGVKEVPVCLLEAVVSEADAGPVWMRDVISLRGDELAPEWRALQGKKTLELCLRFVKEYDSLQPIQQQGVVTWYPRRRPKDSELDLEKSLREQMNLLRVVDNERYPAFFMLGKRKVIIRLECDDSIA